jgi:hypothetical protein
MILCDCDIFRDDVNVIEAFGSDAWATTAIDKINSKLKDSYKAIFIDIDQNTQICTGDVLIVTKQERKKMGENKEYGHVAMAVVHGGRIHTIEIDGSPTKRYLLTHKTRND